MPDLELKDRLGATYSYQNVDTVEVGTVGGGTAVYISEHLIKTQAQSDWAQTDSTQPDYIKSKPTLASVDTVTLWVNESGFMAVKSVPVGLISGLGAATTSALGLVKASSEIGVGSDGTMTIVAIPQNKIAGLESRLTSIEKVAMGGVTYKGAVETFEDLPEGATVGDLYEVYSDNSRWCWNGETWFKYGSTLEEPGYTPNEEQFDIEGTVFSLKPITSENVLHGEDKLSVVLAELQTAFQWTDMG